MAAEAPGQVRGQYRLALRMRIARQVRDSTAACGGKMVHRRANACGNVHANVVVPGIKARAQRN